MKGNRRQQSKREQHNDSSRYDETNFFSQIILERNDPKWSGITEAMLWCVVKLMLCVHKTIFFLLGTEETTFHAFCYRLDSLEADLERDTVWSE